MNFPSIHDLDLDIEELEKHIPEGMVLDIQPPAREYMADPMWFDKVGRDPIDQRKIFRLTSSDELKEKLAAVIEEWPRYGPAIHEKAAMQGRIDIVKILLEMGIESDPKTMKQLHDGEDEYDIPLYANKIEHAYFKAIVHEHLDIVKLYIEEGGVPINYVDEKDGLLAILYAAGPLQGGPNVDIMRWLLENGASIVTKREGEGVNNDLQVAIKGGSVECVKLIMGHQQTIEAGMAVQLDDIRLAAYSGNSDMVRLVLQSDCFGIGEPDLGVAGHGSMRLSNDQILQLYDGIHYSISVADLNSVKLLLRQITPLTPSGSLEPFQIPYYTRSSFYRTVDEALDAGHDIPELFSLLWNTCLHQSPSSMETRGNQIIISTEEQLNRILNTACLNGCPQMVKLLVEQHHLDINHVSYKYFTTPLGRAASSSHRALSGRMEVVKYLCSRPELDLSLAHGKYCNGITPLADAIDHAVAHKRRKPELAEMVRLLLSFGGPVDEIGSEISIRCAQAASEDIVKVHVLLGFNEYRKPVRLALEADGESIDVVLEYTPRELRMMLRGIKIRPEDAVLKANDPTDRPLMPKPGEVASER